MHNSLTNIPIWNLLLQQTQFDNQQVLTSEYLKSKLESVVHADFPVFNILLLIQTYNDSGSSIYLGVFIEEDQNSDSMFVLQDRATFNNFCENIKNSYIISNILDLPKFGGNCDNFIISDEYSDNILKAMEVQWPGQI